MVMSTYQMSATISPGSMASRKKLLAASAGPTWLKYKTRSALVIATYATLRDSRVCSKHCLSGPARPMQAQTDAGTDSCRHRQMHAQTETDAIRQMQAQRRHFFAASRQCQASN